MKQFSDTRSTYFAKLLLFGEFTIIEGGQALATVFDHFHAQWSEGKQDPRLLAFFDYLKQFDFLDSQKILDAETRDLYFNSSIPIGSGLGSSGCITAAAYDLFKRDDITDLLVLKRRLAAMEGYFHGKSSGVDPLTVFANTSLLVDEHKITAEEISLEGFHILDSQVARNSKAMIELYYEKKKDDQFLIAVNKLKTLNVQAIEQLLRHDKESLLETMLGISAIQWEHFNEMITDNMKATWQEGLLKRKYAVKLSGAGGGGFYLAYGHLKGKNVISFT